MANRAIQVADTSGVDRPTRQGPEAAGQTFKQGAILIRSSNAIQISGADPTADILGIANADASGTTGADVFYTPAIGGLLFEATINIGAGTYALDGTELLQDYGVAVDANGIWYIDHAETSAKVFHVMEIVDPVGTVGGRVRGYFIPSVTVY